MKIFAFADEASPNVDGQIAAMNRNGLQGLEIRGVDGTNVSQITAEKAKEVRQKLDDAGLAVWSIGSPIGKIKADEDFAPHMDTFRHTLEIASILGAPNIRLFSFYLPKEQPAAQFRGVVLDRMATLLRTAEGAGITLCHENEKGIYGDTAERCLDLHRELPDLKAVFDPANFVQCGQDTLAAWQMLAPYVKYLHIKDALADGTVVPAGKGAGNVPYIVGQYLAQGGTVFTMEPHLKVFEGLAALEQEGETSAIQNAYPTADAAFDAACGAFRTILEELQ